MELVSARTIAKGRSIRTNVGIAVALFFATVLATARCPRACLVTNVVNHPPSLVPSVRFADHSCPG